MQPLSDKKRRWYFYIFLILFVVLLPIVVLYVQGYRLSKDFKIVRVGGMYIGGVDSEAKVFFDDVLQTDVKKIKRGFFIENLYPAKYLVTIKQEGFTSWSKDIVVKGEKVSEAYPLFVPVQIEAHEIPPQVESGRGFFSSTASTTTQVTNELFTEVAKLFLKDKNTGPVTRQSVTMWSNGTHIYYKWAGSTSSILPALCGTRNCTATSTVYSAFEKINHLDFYPGRNDVALFLLASGIYAVEMDNRLPQHVVEIRAGKNLDFRVEDNERLYVRDGQRLFQVEI